MRMNHAVPVGFIGLGTMGEPMALNLVKAGVRLVVWNRSPAKCWHLGNAGATVVWDPQEVFRQCETVILMLTDGTAIDEVLARGSKAFTQRVKERLVVNMSTTAPSYSKSLDVDIRAHGGRYVEAPVSGSRKPAESGQLVAMLAGDSEDVRLVRSLIAPICRQTVCCGSVPGALFLKLAVNLFMITMVTGLVEAIHLAERHNPDLAQMIAVLDAGPMASDLSRIKAAKLVTRDFERQAAIADVFKNTQLITAAACEAGIASPLINVCRDLFEETRDLGLGGSDMIAVIQAIEQRTAAARVISGGGTSLTATPENCVRDEPSW